MDELARYIRFPEADATENDLGAEELTVPPVATWIGKPMVICQYCHFMEQYGDGPIEYVSWCTLCKRQIEGVFDEA